MISFIFYQTFHKYIFFNDLSIIIIFFMQFEIYIHLIIIIITLYK